jgi:putative endonuclease
VDAEPPSRRLGREGESAALAIYLGRGYRRVATNWSCRLGEIDLIVARHDTLVFCEVKARGGPAFGAPFEAVTRAKQRKLRMLAEAFLTSSTRSPREVRFDVASVTFDARGRANVFLFEQAF